MSNDRAVPPEEIARRLSQLSRRRRELVLAVIDELLASSGRCNKSNQTGWPGPMRWF